MEITRQEYWSGLLCPSPGDLPNPGIEPGSPALQTDSLPSNPPGEPITAHSKVLFQFILFPSPLYHMFSKQKEKQYFFLTSLSQAEVSFRTRSTLVSLPSTDSHLCLEAGLAKILMNK